MDYGYHYFAQPYWIQIYHNDNYKKSCGGRDGSVDSEDSKVCTLFIQNATKEDSGVYDCWSHNQMRCTEDTIKLTFKGKKIPSCAYSLTLTSTLEHVQQLECCKQRWVSGRHWDHITNEALYRNIPPVSISITEGRLSFSGHNWRSKTEMISKCYSGKQSREKSKRTLSCYLYWPIRERRRDRDELPGSMEDRKAVCLLLPNAFELKIARVLCWWHILKYLFKLTLCDFVITVFPFVIMNSVVTNNVQFYNNIYIVLQNGITSCIIFLMIFHMVMP